MNGRRRTGVGSPSSLASEHQQVIRNLVRMPISCFGQTAVYRSIGSLLAMRSGYHLADSLHRHTPASVSSVVLPAMYLDRIFVAFLHFASSYPLGGMEQQRTAIDILIMTMPQCDIACLAPAAARMPAPSPT